MNARTELAPETKDAPIEFKAGSEPGSFTGYGAVFGNVDDGGDIIQADAFRKIRTMKNGRIRIPLSHDMSNIIGEADVVQDSKGLRVDGQIYVDDADIPEARRAYALMKRGALDAMSVGFNIMEKGSTWSEDSRQRTITKAELWEVSIVPFGMNRKARVQNIKSASELTARDIEDVIRSCLPSISRRKATAIASAGYRLLQGEPASGPGDERDAHAGASVTLADLQGLFAKHAIY